VGLALHDLFIPAQHVALDARLPRRGQRKAEWVLRPVHASAAIEAMYRARLLRLIDEMNASVTYWLRAAFRSNPPEMSAVLAQDELSSSALRAAMRKLVKRWLARFDEAALKLADYFARDVSQRSDRVLRKILKEGGFAVEFKMTAAQRDVLGAAVNENVSLIKSIPQQYLTQVEGLVMRSVQRGRDLGPLAEELQKQFGVTRRRAALIARDQNNKINAALNRARQVELGITEAIWVHTHGGKTPRPSHVKAGRDRVRYDIRTGWWDPDEKKFILPGELINCRCISRPVIKGYTG
jgi:uncharacterized protein with gpF-like domain